MRNVEKERISLVFYDELYGLIRDHFAEQGLIGSIAYVGHGFVLSDDREGCVGFLGVAMAI